MTTASPSASTSLRDSRRRLVLDGLGIVASALGFGLVYGLSARAAGLSLVEAVAMSTLVFAGAAQFAAVGYIAGGLGWPAIVLLTAFVNARHLLYSAALAPWLTGTPRPTRAAMAYTLTDEAFALSIAHFRRLGRLDQPGYWYAAIVTTWIPWNLATVAGVLLGGAVADPAPLGLDVVFPAAMAGLARRARDRPARGRRGRCRRGHRRPRLAGLGAVGGDHRRWARRSRRRDARARRSRPARRTRSPSARCRRSTSPPRRP